MFTEVQSRVVKRESTRRKVLAAAERLFREQGFGVATIRQIASDAAEPSWFSVIESGSRRIVRCVVEARRRGATQRAGSSLR